MSWRRGPRPYGTGQNNPFQGPQGPRPHVPQPGPWGQNAQGAWQQNPGQGVRNPNAQGQRFQNPRQNQQNNTDYRDPNRAISSIQFGQTAIMQANFRCYHLSSNKSQT